MNLRRLRQKQRYKELYNGFWSADCRRHSLENRLRYVDAEGDPDHHRALDNQWRKLHRLSRIKEAKFCREVGYYPSSAPSFRGGDLPWMWKYRHKEAHRG